MDWDAENEAARIDDAVATFKARYSMSGGGVALASLARFALTLAGLLHRAIRRIGELEKQL